MLLCLSQARIHATQHTPTQRVECVQQWESVLALWFISHPTGLRPVTVALASVCSSHPERVQVSGDTCRRNTRTYIHAHAHAQTQPWPLVTFFPFPLFFFEQNKVEEAAEIFKQQELHQHHTGGYFKDEDIPERFTGFPLNMLNNADSTESWSLHFNYWLNKKLNCYAAASLCMFAWIWP